MGNPATRVSDRPGFWQILGRHPGCSSASAMSARFLPFLAGSVFTATVGLLGIGVSQAQSRPAVVQPVPQVQAVQALAAPVVAPPPSKPQPMFEPRAASDHGEQTLDTSGGPVIANALPKPGSRVRTPSDENLPRWVPTRGRLTVVDSSDLAENLGLVPRGTAKRTGEHVSAQDKLEEESQARAAQARAAPQPPQGFAFSVKSHVRSHR